MSTELHRMVSLIILTNAKLHGHEVDYRSDHSTIKFAQRVSFPNAPTDAVYEDSKLIAKDPSNWIKFLKNQNVTHLKIHYTSSPHELPDRISVAFVGGGGSWMIEAVHGSNCDIWEKGERTSAALGARFLGFHFIQVVQDHQQIGGTSDSVEVAHERLKTALENIEKFARGHEHTHHWAENFKNSLNTLLDSIPKEFDEIVPLGILDQDARQLIAAAYSSWVFGGMGSWNDLAFSGDEQKRYEEVTDSLFSAIHLAIIAGVNSYP
ncbi:MAG: hypothetical protein KAR33_12415 [Candidatus Thorarchaeota archaeon]|nr:hypothetical protein [Candidatus Thorarchaeota archaeon]